MHSLSDSYSDEEPSIMAAEDINIVDLPEDKKIALLRQVIVTLVGYVSRK